MRAPQSINALIGPAPEGRYAYRIGLALKYLLLFGGAIAVWCLLGDGSGKVRYHGIVIGGLAAYLAIQEAYFQVCRTKLNEPLSSPAVEISDLESLHKRVVAAKAYLDTLWKVAVPAKFIAMIAGLTLFWGGNPGIAFSVGGGAVSWNDVAATLGWFSTFIGIDLTWRTFSFFHHVDSVNTKLSVRAKEITFEREAAAKLKAADPGKEWAEDPTPKGYRRLRLKNP